MEVLTWAMMTIGSAYGLWLFVLAIAGAEEAKRRAGELAWLEQEKAWAADKLRENDERS